MSLDSIVSVSITTLTTAVSRAGFGTPLIASYFPTSVYGNRVKSYSTLSEMTADGFLTTDAAYLIAQKLKSQNPSVTSWKVGRRALHNAQAWQLTPTITTEGEILTVDVEGTTISYTIPASATVASIVTAMTALINAIVGVAGTDNTTYIGIASNRYTSCTVTVTTEDNSQDFTITVDGTAYTYSSDTSATKTEIRDGLKALIDAGGENVTTADNSTDAIDFTTVTHRGFAIAVTAGGSGVLTISAQVLSKQLIDIGNLSAGLSIVDATTDPGWATDLAAIEAEDDDWYGLLIDVHSEPEIKAVAAWAEARKILFGASSLNTELKDAAVTTCVASDLKALGYARTYLIFSEKSQDYSAAGWMGRMFPKDPGSATWAYKQLSGVTASNLTTAEVNALDGKNCNYYYLEGGVNITRDGVSPSGEYLDITRGVDWFRARLQERIFSRLVNNEKLPFTDATGDLIRSDILAQLEEGQNKGVIAPNTEAQPWVITIPAVSTISANDKALRLYTGIEFSAYLAGAVHELQIQGTLSV